MAHPAPEAILEFVEQLPEQDVRWLYHVLNCPQCRDIALAEWIQPPEEQAPATEAPWQPPISSRGREEAEPLLAELLQLRPKPRERAVREPRFHKRALLELILAKSEEMQAANPRQAVDLAWLAVALANAGPSCSHLWWAYSLAGNASRLRGEMAEAERCFDSAAFYRPVASHERGLLCRFLALLRWDRGLLCDTAALLRHASELFNEGGDPREEGACLALLGLLHTEQREYPYAVGPLVRARRSMPPQQRPWLWVRTGLSLALCFTQGRSEEDLGHARQLQEEVRDFGRAIQDPLERLRIQALEGRVAAGLEDRTQAEMLLDSARRGLLANRWLAEASVVSLDLALLFIETNRREKIARLIAELEANSAGIHALKKVVRALQQLAGDELVPRERARVLASHLRQVFRHHQIAEPVVRWI